MVFESFIAAHWTLLGGVLLIAIILGAVVNKTDFCTMGAISDIVNMQLWQRMRMWLGIIGLVLLGVSLLEPLGLIEAEATTPPYRSAQLAWAGYILGGLLFGIGMTLGSGCGNKTLTRIGAGNLKSLLVAAVLGVLAYYMSNPLPGIDPSLRSLLFGWVDTTAIAHSQGQDLGSLVAGGAAQWVRPVLGMLLGGGLLLLVLRTPAFRRDRNALLGTLTIALCVLGIWALSSNIWVADGMGNQETLQDYAVNWSFYHPGSEAGRPESTQWLAPQGVTFIGPLAQSTAYTASGFQAALITTGVMLVGGVTLGSLLWSVISGSFRVQWFADRADLARHLAGGALMGIGGPLAMGCTFGQGITGLATLALGAFLATGAIILGSAVTMRIQYYRLLHEDEATLGKALLTSLVDLRLLPASMRRLDALE